MSSAATQTGRATPNRALTASSKLFTALLTAAIAFIALAMLPHTAAAAISLGSVTGARELASVPGDTISFDLLLFNTHVDSTLGVVIEVEGPGGWETHTSPEGFDLRFSPPGRCVQMEGYECLSTGQGGIMAKPARVVVEVPDSAQDMGYPIKATIYINGEGGDMSMQQSRTYDFVVKVDSDLANKGVNGDGAPVTNPSANQQNDKDTDTENQSSANVQGSEDPGTGLSGLAPQPPGETPAGPDALTGMILADTVGIGVFVVILVFTILFSWRIYKHG
jgi:hypothetical protein